jgi:hypothetical protein
MHGRETVLVTSIPLRRILTVAEADGKTCQDPEDAEMQFLDLPLRRVGFRLKEGRFRAVLGMSSGTVADTENLSLRLESGLVYVPPQSFTVPEALPPPWVDLLVSKTSGTQLSLKTESVDALHGDSRDCSGPMSIVKSVAPRVVLHFRLRGLHGLPGAQPGDPYVVELVVFQLVKVRQQTYCIERNRANRGDTEVLAPVQLDASVALDDLSTDSLRATLRRQDAAFVRCVRRGGRSALCPALQVALPLDRFEHSGAKRITGAFELSPPIGGGGTGGASRNGELAHLFAGFSLELTKREAVSDIPALGPSNAREERLAGVGSEIAPELVLRGGQNADQELPEVGGRGVEKVNKPLIWRASTQLGSQLSMQYRSKRSIFRSRKSRRSTFLALGEQEIVEDDDDDEDDDDEDDDADEDVESNAIKENDDCAHREGDSRVAKTAFSKAVTFSTVKDENQNEDEEDEYEQETDMTQHAMANQEWDDDTFAAFIDEYMGPEDTKLSLFCSTLPRSQFNKLRIAFTAYSSTGNYSTGRLLPESLDKVLGELGYQTLAGSMFASCMDLGIVDRETRDIDFKGFLVLMEAYFRDHLEVDVSESEESDESDQDEEEPLVITL